MPTPDIELSEPAETATPHKDTLRLDFLLNAVIRDGKVELNRNDRKSADEMRAAIDKAMAVSNSIVRPTEPKKVGPSANTATPRPKVQQAAIAGVSGPATPEQGLPPGAISLPSPGTKPAPLAPRATRGAKSTSGPTPGLVTESIALPTAAQASNDRFQRQTHIKPPNAQ